MIKHLLDSAGRSITNDRVHRIAPVESEVLAKFLLQSSLDGLQDVVEDAEVGWVLLIVLTTLEHTSADQASVPTVVVTSDDVGGRVVTDHVDVLW